MFGQRNEWRGWQRQRRQASTRKAKKVVLTPASATRDASGAVAAVLARALPALTKKRARQVIDMALRATAWQCSISSAHNGVRHEVTDRHVMRILAGNDRGILENSLNDELWKQGKLRLPQRPVVAVDATLIPYHGQHHEDASKLRRSKAQSGTTWFHAYASLNIVEAGKRHTLALTFVEKGESMATVMKRLVDEVQSRGIKIHRLLADKGFCTKTCIHVLQSRGVSFVIPLALRGRAARALQRGRGAYTTTHVLAGIELPVAVRVKRNLGKYHGRKPGNHYFPYLYWGFEADAKQMDKLYRRRGGIETTYRIMNQARARTSTRRPSIRLFLFGVSMLLQNA